VPIHVQWRVGDGKTKGSYTEIGGGEDPFWQLDLGLEGLPIKEVLLISLEVGSQESGFFVRVGDEADPYANSLCNS